MITSDTARPYISGDLEIARDKTGSTTALALQKRAASDIVDALQNDASPPVKLAVNR